MRLPLKKVPELKIPYFAYVGSRTTRARNARGDGLTVWRIDSDQTTWSVVQTLDDLVNPSFLALDRQHRHLYAVHGDLSDISAFRIDSETGRLDFINRQSTQGKNPVHLAVDPSGRFIVLANHITSSLAVLPILPDGGLGAVTELYPLSGSLGPHRVEQNCAKPHQTEFDKTGAFIAVPDKGLDKTFIFRLLENGRLAQVSEMAGREGSGPRHIIFHKSNNFAWIVNELDSTVTSCQFAPRQGVLTPFQILSSLPDTYTGNSRAAEIVISHDGRFVYVSNRGCDSIAAFAVAPTTGRLQPLGWTSSQGQTPRFITLAPDGAALFVANEDSDTIINFSLDAQTGHMQAARVAARTGSPICIVFIPACSRANPAP